MSYFDFENFDWTSLISHELNWGGALLLIQFYLQIAITAVPNRIKYHAITN